MKALFVYKYLTLGGVETVLRSRLDGLPDFGVDAHAWFLSDHGGRSIFDGLEKKVHVGDAAACARFARAFPLVTSIDTEEVLPALAQSGAAVAIECHTPYLENLGYLWRLQSKPAAFIVPSEYQRTIVRERVGDSAVVRVAPNPLRSIFLQRVQRFPVPFSRPVVAWIGRMDELKNWRGFLTIMGVLKSAGTEFDVWLVGAPVDVADEDDIRAAITDEGLSDRVRRFRGVDHRVIPAMLDAVRDSGGLVVSTSRGESFGMSVAEAMARECAVVVPRWPPLSQLVEDGLTGVLVDPDDAEAAAGEIASLLRDHPRRRTLGCRAARRVIADYGPGPALLRFSRTLHDVVELHALQAGRAQTSV